MPPTYYYENTFEQTINKFLKKNNFGKYDILYLYINTLEFIQGQTIPLAL